MFKVLRRPSPTPPARPDAAAGPLDLLLGRPAVTLATPEVRAFLAGRRVLVTGAGGSIGSELCRQVARFGPETLTMLDRSEAALFEAHHTLASTRQARLRPVIADVCDRPRLRMVFADTRPHVVFHAAAHKHVGLMEHNPGEAVKVNVLGTAWLADAAADAGAAAFVLVSTDKAADPAGVMGATKRAAEIVLGVRADRFPRTAFSCVRFGNVIGSSGSVVTIFRRQIATGGPVTVTDPAMRRYLMTIPEAAGLVLHAGATASGGETFVLDMGEPVRIVDLAHAMIRHAGLEPGRDIAVRFVGAGPGEKLEEEPCCAPASTRPTRHPKIRVSATPGAGDGTDPALLLARFVDASPELVRRALRAAVPEYAPAPPQPVRLPATSTRRAA